MGLDASQIDPGPDRVTFGHGGWVRVSLGGEVEAYVRFRSYGNRLEMVEQYAKRIDGGPMRAADRKRIRWGAIVNLCNRRDYKPLIEERMGIPGPDLARAAAAFATNYSVEPPRYGSHWVRDMLVCQHGLPDGPRQAPWPGRRPRPMAPMPGGKRSERHEADPWKAAPLDARVTIPASATYPPSFYEEVARIYKEHKAAGLPPNVAMVKANKGVKKTTVDRWVRRARQLGFLEPARRGNPSGGR